MTFNMYQGDGVEPIAVLRPQLPSARRLLPYLERIDQARIYSNWGPLVVELSERLCQRFAVPDGSVVCANSGMAALVGGILASAGTPKDGKRLALVPDYTFTASALAVQACGYELAIGTCHRDAWTFSPDDLLAHADLLDRTGLVTPVAPYGAPIDQAPWLRFQERTGIPVVIDGAACFDAFANQPGMGIGPLAVAVSFHATKAFGVGEGGAVVTTDSDLATRALRCLNFGFLNSRNTGCFSTNGKMAEYSAAVGLAELDGWSDKQQRMKDVFAAYQRALSRPRAGVTLVGTPQISCAYVLLQCASAQQARHVTEALARDRIDTRLWYGMGLHAHDSFRAAHRVDLHGPDVLDPATLIGLPMAPDLGTAQIDRICRAIDSALPQLPVEAGV